MMMWRDQDVSAMIASAPALMSRAAALRHRAVQPNLSVRAAVQSEVLKLVAERGRKVYGGYALNAALIERIPSASFYNDDAGCGDQDGAVGVAPDIEFYSPDPVGDAMELCDRLYAQGMRYVQAREAMHHHTFTVSVHFVRLCDITYMPPALYGAVPVLEVPAGGGFGGSIRVNAVHPHFALVDMLRILTDPHTSWWRLDKALARTALLQQHFPLQPAPPQFRAADTGLVISRSDASDDDLAVRAWLSGRPSCVLVGVGAYVHIMGAGGEWLPAMHVVVSAQMGEDTLDLLRSLQQRHGEGKEGVWVRSCTPLSDLTGVRMLVMVRGRCVACVYDPAGRAVPIGSCTEDGVQVASFAYTLQTLLIARFHSDVCGFGSVATQYTHLAASMLQERSCRLDSAAQTVLDDTPMRELVIDAFVGEPRSPMHTHMLWTDARRAAFGASTVAWFSYDPSKHAGNRHALARYQFLDVTGGAVGDVLPLGAIYNGAPSTLRQVHYETLSNCPKRMGCAIHPRA
jgi:hypothetical protein